MKKLTIYLLSLPIISLICLIIFIAIPPPPLLDNSFSTAVYDKNHKLLRLTITNDEQYRLFTPLKDISPLLIQTTLLQEDRYFYHHFGVNPLSLFNAVWETYIKKHRRIGGSTLTMQLARIRFNINSHGISGKFLQILRAVQLEAHYSKQQILEAYLNLAPYGNNIQGVGSASLIYYHKSVSNLNLAQALTLSVIPQNPLKRSPNKSNSRELKTARDNLYTRWITLHPEDIKQRTFISLPLQTFALKSLPFRAPHFVTSVLREFPNQQELITTLDDNLQRVLERITTGYIKQKKTYGITNSVSMLVDTRDMSVTALVGSADFFNVAIGGQVNGTQAKRSPGSALKPFVYALALDQGLIHPATILKDTPMSFGAYNPENFDYEFYGPVKATDALNLSRNIPAVDLANRLHSPTLYEFLKSAEISKLKSAQHYGLSLVLGSAEVSMEEMSQLYATLANHGLYKPLRFLTNQPDTLGKRLLSPEAAFLTLDMLEKNPRPGKTVITSISNNSLPIAWKTGTSAGFHDAWSAAVVGPYVLVVWVGNFDNTKNSAFIGKEAAAPLLFDIIDAMSKTHNLPARAISPIKLNVTQIDICDASGQLPTRYCPAVTKTWFIPGKSPITKDTVFKPVMIDYKTGLRACHFDPKHQFIVYEFWPSDLLDLFKKAGIARRIPPPFNQECILSAQILNGLPPQITSPKSGISYTLSSELTNKSLLPFSAVTSADVHTLYWFINERYLGQAKNNEHFFWQAKPGHYLVRVVDDFGRTDARDFHVEQVG